METDTLHLIGTDALLSELLSRFDYCVFNGGRVLDLHGDQLFTHRYKGTHMACLGLTTHLQHQISSDLNRILKEDHAF